jgi:hypothetical protein
LGWYNEGVPWYQGTIILPRPNHINEYIVFHENTVQINAVNRLYYSIADMSISQLTDKDHLLTEDTLSGGMTAVRHANGRDWWLIVPEAESNCYYILLITPTYVGIVNKQCLGESCVVESGGQAVFSPDGKKYIRANPNNGVNIYDFDRCSGTLSNPIHFMVSQDTINNYPYTQAWGAIVSPNNRYLYIPASYRLLQFDLQAADIETSKISIGTWVSDTLSNSLLLAFYAAAYAPDGKIYVSSFSSHYMHVIEQPDLPGVQCALVQHGVQFPAFTASSFIPNFPYYGLGREIGSACDTIYTSISPPQNISNIQLSPNPTSGELRLSFSAATQKEGVFVLYDVLGNKIKETIIPANTTEYKTSLSEIANGTYFYVWNNVFSGKLNILK